MADERHSPPGIIRAELRLHPPGKGARLTAIPGRGILHPLWDIGQRTAAGQPDLRVARVWVEHVPELAPGATGSIRFAPLDPPGWPSLRPGQPITMHEGVPMGGTGAIIAAVNPPECPGSSRYRTPAMRRSREGR